MEKFCQLDEASHQVLERMMIKFGYSGRTHNLILKVARTIADLAGVEQISQQHLMEAVQYCSRDRNSASKKSNKVTQITQYQPKKRALAGQSRKL